MVKKYLLGLDLGTDSVGWCVTDENDKIVKKGGKSLWGARLFDEASSAAERRTNRTVRRRLARRKQRMELLQLLFKEEIDKVDPSFFLRLNEAAYHREDKDESISSLDYLLFVDKSYSDIDFYKEYPTIYHLRKSLMESNEKADIRLIYLAMAHMVKYRGNFLNEGQEIRPFDPDEGEALFKELKDELLEMGRPALKWDDSFVESLKTKVVASRGISAKKDALVELFGCADPYFKNVVFALISGGKILTKKIYENDIEDDDIDPKSIQFSDANFEESYAKLTELFPSAPETEMIGTAKKIFDFLLLGKLLGDSKTISDAMVNRYKVHKDDLKALKTYIKSNLGATVYNDIFRKYEEKTHNYVHYIGLTNTKVKNQSVKVRCSHCSKEEFYSYLKTVLKIDKAKKAEDITDPFLKDVYLKIDDGTYLERQNSSDNGVYPYQLNKQEMVTILEKQSKYYPFLNYTDKDGISTKEKIVKILEFKIPYYVGPLLANNGKDQRGHFSWIVRNEDKEKIYPWNFDKLVDKDKSAEEFIKRMLNKCAYLPDCNCLPKNSLLFQEYEVLSLLNKTLVNGAFLSPETKKDLIENVFKKNTKVSPKTIVSHLKNKTGEKDVTLQTSGGKELDDFNASLSSYCFFSKILGKEYVDSHIEQIEDIIRDLTIFEDSSIVVRRLDKVYHITDKQAVNAIKNKRMTGWGRLSRELLEKMKTPFETTDGEYVEKSLISLMRETNLNLMELIHDKRFTFEKQIKEANNQLQDSFDSPEEKHQAIVDYVDSCYVSPGMKRPLIQAMAIVEDVEKILHAPIDEYYVECTRSNKAKKQKTNSRKEMLETYYKEAKKLAKADIEKEMVDRAYEELEKADLGKFRSDKYFLYFLQMGRDMYSLKPIDMADLANYDIDHIIPQALIKDDSISNRVLVHSNENRSKSATYPLTDSMFSCGRAKANAFYHFLKEAKLISEKKYASLTRITPLTEEELTSFVNRQLVYTNQAVKALVSLIEHFQKDQKGETPKVVYSKAENVSDFRQKYGIVKSRDANDFHHAHDAYLNICVGRAISTYFNRFVKIALYGKNGNADNAKRFLANVNAQKASLNLDNVFEEYFDENGVCNRKQLKDTDGGIAWDYSTFVSKIKENIYSRYDVMTTTMQYIKGGALTKATILPKGAGLVPLKMNGPLSNTEKYGGKTQTTYGFYTLVEREFKGKTLVTLVPMPNLYCDPSNQQSIAKYLEKKQIKVKKILIPCLRANAVVKCGSSKAIISGVGHESKDYHIKNVSGMFYSENEIATLKKIRKLLDILAKNKTPVTSEKAVETIHEFMVQTEDGLVISPSNGTSKEIKLMSRELEALYKKYANLNSNYLSLLKGATGIVNLLNDGVAKEKFAVLPIHLQAYQMMQLANYFNSSIQSINMSLLGGVSSAGVLTITANLPPNCSIIVESPTGFFTKTLWKGC